MRCTTIVAIASVVLTASASASWWQSSQLEPRVNITLYYEGLCGGCHAFILNQLWPTYGRLEEYLNVDILPFGNARMKMDNGTVTFICQHGPDECYVNEVQTCAVKYVHPTKKLLDFVACMLRYPDPTKAGEPCAQKSSTDWGVLDRCSRGPEGKELLYEMGKRTRGHQPPIRYVPWVDVNGAHNDTIAARTMEDLFGFVCELLGSEKPPVCDKSKRVHEFCLA